MSDENIVTEKALSNEANEIYERLSKAFPDLKISKDILLEADLKLQVKDADSRYLQYSEVQQELLNEGPSLLPGTSDLDDYRMFLSLTQNLERIWADACDLYMSGSYPRSTYFSILALEELGKLAVTRFDLLNNMSRRHNGQPIPVKSPKRNKTPFYSHTQKHLLAAGAGALINARLDRILGIEQVSDFLDKVEANEIEHLRQKCLYVDFDGTKTVFPDDVIDKSTAKFYVVLAGELLAEIGGYGNEEFERLLQSVKAFELSIGHANE